MERRTCTVTVKLKQNKQTNKQTIKGRAQSVFVNLCCCFCLCLCLWTCVCVLVFVNLCLCVCELVNLWTCELVFVFVLVFVNLWTCELVNLWTCELVFVFCVCVCVCVCVYVCVYVCFSLQVFTSVPPLAIGLFDRTVTQESMLKYPKLYKYSQNAEIYNSKVMDQLFVSLN